MGGVSEGFGSTALNREAYKEAPQRHEEELGDENWEATEPPAPLICWQCVIYTQPLPQTMTKESGAAIFHA